MLAFYPKVMGVFISWLQSALSGRVSSPLPYVHFLYTLSHQRSVTNPLAGAPSRWGTCYLFNPFSSTAAPGLRNCPEAVTLFDTGVEGNHTGFHRNTLSSISNTTVRYYLIHPIFVWIHNLVRKYLFTNVHASHPRTTAIHSPLCEFPPHDNMDESLKYNMDEAREIGSQRVCAMDKVSVGLEARLVVVTLWGMVGGW